MVKGLLAGTVITIVCASPNVANSQVISITPKNSKIEFTISHLGVLSVVGTFTEFSGNIAITGKKWSISGVTHANSISTGNSERDETVKTEQYMDVNKFPEIRFTGSGIENQSTVTVSGKLTIKNVIRPITFILSRVEKDDISGAFIINRSAFNLTFGAMDVLIGNEIEVKLVLQPDL